jgi:N-methylhydantoinase A/oxoprolinase/acetone carboxylase beta subunit
VALLPTRAGVAACLGGPRPALTDALRVAGRTRLGEEALARAALEGVGAALGLPADEVACRAIDAALGRMQAGIEDMFRAWRGEQVYRIWQLKARSERRPDVAVGVGAAAEPLVPALAERLGAQAVIPPYAEVANALGAALARTTYTTTLHVDTQRRQVEVAEEGLVEPLSARRYSLDDARRLAREWMSRRGEGLGIVDPLMGCREVLAEQFNVVQGWTTVGRIIDVRLERSCGLVGSWERDDA